MRADLTLSVVVQVLREKYYNRFNVLYSEGGEGGLGHLPPISESSTSPKMGVAEPFKRLEKRRKMGGMRAVGEGGGDSWFMVGDGICLVNEEEELGEADGVELAQDSEHYESHFCVCTFCLIKCFVRCTSVCAQCRSSYLSPRPRNTSCCCE